MSLLTPETIAERGIEAWGFLKFLQLMFFLYTALSFTLLPALGCYTTFKGPSTKTTDWLVVLSWANISSEEANVCWLYTILVPSVVAVVSAVIARELYISTKLRSLESDGSARHYILVPRGHRLKNAQDFNTRFHRWRENLSSIAVVEAPAVSLQTLSDLVNKIERSETLFIAKMLHKSKQMQRAAFRTFLESEIRTRYTRRDDTVGYRRFIGIRAVSSIIMLYQQLHSLDQSSVQSNLLQTIRSRLTNPGSFLVSVDDFHAARAIVHSARFDGEIRQASYLGMSLWDICITHLNKTSLWTSISKGAVRLCLIMLAASLSIPMAFAGSVSQVGTLFQEVSSLKALRIPDDWITAAQGVLPPVLTSIIMSVFPLVARWILQYGQHSTRTQLEVDVSRYYLTFLIVQLLIVPTISSALVSTICGLIGKDLTRLPKLLATNLPLAGNYYLSYLVVQAINLLSGTILRVVPLFRVIAFSGRTTSPRERLQYLRSLQYQLRWGDLYAFYSALACIALTFSLLTPLILPAAAVLFGLALLTYGFAISHLCGDIGQTDGRLKIWALLNIFIGLYVCQLTFIGLFLLKLSERNRRESLAQIFVLSLTLVIFVQFHLYLKHKYSSNHMVLKCPTTLRASEAKVSELPHTITLDDDVHAGILPQRKICIPRDAVGISQSIIKEASGYFSDQRADYDRWITDEYATIGTDGRVLLTAEASNVRQP